jgi:hypothetical protein
MSLSKRYHRARRRSPQGKGAPAELSASVQPYGIHVKRGVALMRAPANRWIPEMVEQEGHTEAEPDSFGEVVRCDWIFEEGPDRYYSKRSRIARFVPGSLSALLKNECPL